MTVFVAVILSDANVACLDHSGNNRVICCYARVLVPLIDRLLKLGGEPLACVICVQYLEVLHDYKSRGLRSHCHRKTSTKLVETGRILQLFLSASHNLIDFCC